MPKNINLDPDSFGRGRVDADMPEDQTDIPHERVGMASDIERERVTREQPQPQEQPRRQSQEQPQPRPQSRPQPQEQPRRRRRRQSQPPREPERQAPDTDQELPSGGVLAKFDSFMRGSAKRKKKKARLKKIKSKKNALSKEKQEKEFFDKATTGDALSFYRKVSFRRNLYAVASFIVSFVFYAEFLSPDWVTTFFKGLASQAQQSLNTGADLSSALIQIGSNIDNISRAWGAIFWMVVGFIFSLALTLMIVHSHSVDKRGFSFRKWLFYAFVAFVALGFNVFTEVASTMDRADERVRVKSVSDPITAALLKNVGKGSSDNPAMSGYIAKIARWEANVRTRCDRYITTTTASGKTVKNKNIRYSVKHCSINQGHLSAAKASLETFKKISVSDKQDNINQARTAMHNTDYAQMIIKLVMDKMGWSFVTSTAAVALYIVFTFEILGMMIGEEYARAIRFLKIKGIDLHGDLGIKELKSELNRKIKADLARADHRVKTAEAQIESTARVAKAQNKVVMAKLKAKKELFIQTQAASKEFEDFLSGTAGGDSDGRSIGFVDTDNLSRAIRMIDAQHQLIMGSGNGILNSSNTTASRNDSNGIGFTASVGESQPLPLDNTPILAPPDFEGLSTQALKIKRQEAKNNISLSAFCPTCNESFDRLTTGQVFCHPIHTREFNNELRRRKRAGIS